MSNDSLDDCRGEMEVVDCLDKPPLLYIYIVCAVWTFVIGMIGFGLLWHRVVNRKLSIFYFGTGYLIRPKPIESMLLFLSISSIVDCIKIALLLTGKSPSEFLSSILASLPREFITCAFSCYLFGIAHTICSSYKIGNRRYEMSKRIDIICTAFILLPFVTSNICAIGLTISINQQNTKSAAIFFNIHYLQWLLYWSILAICILFAGLRLIKILKKHLQNQNKQGNRESIRKSRLAIFKVRMTMAIGICSTLIFIFVRYFYTFMENYFSNNYTGTMICYGIIIYHSTLASTLIIMTMIFNPKAFNPLSASSPSSDDTPESYNNPDATILNFANPTDESTLATSPIENSKSEKISLSV